MRVRSAESELKQQRLMADYSKAREIKNRITRFINSDNKIQLKYRGDEAGSKGH